MTNLIIIATMVYTNLTWNPVIPVVRIEAKSANVSNAYITNQLLAVKIINIDTSSTNWFLQTNKINK
jgi:hypothetical protein